MDDFDFEILSADDKYLYINNKQISSLDKIFPDIKNAKSFKIVIIYNLPNRKFLFQLEYLDIVKRIPTSKWCIYNLEDNSVSEIDIESLLNLKHLGKIYITQHPSQNGVFIVRAQLPNWNIHYVLLIIDNDITTKDLVTIEQKGFGVSIMFSSSSNLDDYIVIRYKYNSIIENTKYEGVPVKAYININQPLVIADNKTTIDVVNLEDNKVIKSFKKSDYNFMNIGVKMVGNDDYTILAISDNKNSKTILLLSFTSSEIIAKEIVLLKSFDLVYIDIYGLGIHYINEGYIYTLFNNYSISDISFEITGNIMAVNHELYETQLKELVGETEIYAPLQNIVEEYL